MARRPRIAGAFPGLDMAGVLPETRLATGAGQGAMVAAQEGASLAARIDSVLQRREAEDERRRERAEIEQARIEGEAAGEADPKAQRREGTSPAALQYNRSIAESGTRRLEIDFRAKADELALAHPSDPVGLRNALTAHRNGIASGLPEDIRSRFVQGSDLLMQPYFNQAGRNNHLAVADERIASFNDLSRQRFIQGQQLARQSIVDPAAAAALDRLTDTQRESLAALGPKHAFTWRGREYPADPTRAGALTVAEIERQFGGFRDGMLEATAMGQHYAGPRTLESVDAWENAMRGTQGVRRAPPPPGTLDPVYAAGVRALESPDGRTNPQSGAAGPYQIMPALRASYPPGTSDDEILRQFTEANRTTLRGQLGREPTQSELFLAHRLGAGAAAAVLKAPPGTALETVLAPIFDGSSAMRPSWAKVQEQNPYLRRAGTTDRLAAAIDAQWSNATAAHPPAEGLTDDQISRFAARMRADVAQRNAVHAIDLAQLRADGEAALARIGAGYDVGPTTFLDMARRAAELGDPRLAQRFTRQGEVQQVLLESRALPLPELQRAAAAAVERANADGADATSAVLADGYRNLVAQKQAALAADPLAYGARIHSASVGALGNLDFADRDGAMAGLARRTRQAARIAQMEGLPEVLPLTAPEIEGLKRHLGKVGPEAQAATLGMLQAALPQGQMNALMRKLATGDSTSQVFAVAAGIAQDDQGMARQILDGHALIRDAKMDVGTEQARRQVLLGLEVGNALRGAAAESIEQIMLGAAGLYASRIARTSGPAAAFDSSAFGKAVRDVAGEPLNWNGQSLLPPRRDIDQAGLNRIMAGLTDADLANATTTRLQPITADMVRRFGMLRSIGDGVVEVDFQQGTALAGDGRAFRLDLRALADRPAVAAPPARTPARSRVMPSGARRIEGWDDE